MVTLRNRAVHGVRWSGLSSASTLMLSLFQTTILARLLDPKDFGLIAIVMVVIGLAQIFSDMGVTNAIIHRQDATRNELSSLYWLNIIASIVVFVVVVAASSLFSRLFTEHILGRLLFWGALVFVVNALSHQFYILLQKGLNFKALAMYEIASAAIGAGVTVASAFSGEGVFSFVWGHIATASSKTLFAAFSWKDWCPGIRFRISDLRGYVSFGMYQMGQRSIDHLSWNMDKLIIGRILGSEALGYYSIAYQLIVRPTLLINPVITQVAFPVFSSIQDNNAKLRDGYLEMTKILAFINIPIYMGMFAVAGPLVGVYLGAGWEPVTDVLRIMALLGIFFALGNTMGSLLLAKGRADLGFWLNFMCLPVFAGSVYFGSFWGINGVAWALLLAGGVGLTPVNLWLYRYLVGLKPLEYLKPVLPFAVIGSVMAVVVSIASAMMHIYGNAVELAVLVPLGAFLYIGCSALFEGPFLRQVINMIVGID